MSDTTIQFRIDEKTRKDAEKVFDHIGINMSVAMRVFLRKVVITGTIPFTISLNKDEQ